MFSGFGPIATGSIGNAAWSPAVPAARLHSRVSWLYLGGETGAVLQVKLEVLGSPHVEGVARSYVRGPSRQEKSTQLSYSDKCAGPYNPRTQRSRTPPAPLRVPGAMIGTTVP